VNDLLGNYTPSCPITVQRLLFLAQHASEPKLSLEALRTAQTLVKEYTMDTDLYEQISEKLKSCGDSADAEWIKRTGIRFFTDLETRNDHLEKQKFTLRRELIRDASLSLARLLVSRGDYASALTHLYTTREFSSNPSEVLQVSWDIAQVSIFRQELVAFPLVAISKALADCQSAPEYPNLAFKLYVCISLHYLSTSNFKQTFAALKKACAFKVCALDFLSLQDLARLAGLTALHALSRKELNSEVIQDRQVRSLINHSPILLRSIESFCMSNYSLVLQGLEAIRDELSDDIFLRRHELVISEQVLNKCMTDYVSAYSSLGIQDMALAFALPLDGVEKNLINLIQSNAISCRIDTRTKILSQKSIDQNQTHISKMLENTDLFLTEFENRLLRINLQRRGVKSHQRRPSAEIDRMDIDIAPLGLDS